MKPFTVVCFYTDNDQPYVAWVTAQSPSDAVAVAAASAESGITVVEVFEGHHKGVLGNEHLTSYAPHDVGEPIEPE